MQYRIRVTPMPTSGWRWRVWELTRDPNVDQPAAGGMAPDQSTAKEMAEYWCEHGTQPRDVEYVYTKKS